MKIQIEEIGNGFILMFYDDKVPSDMDRRFHVKTMKNALDETVKYYEKILAWRRTVEENEDQR